MPIAAGYVALERDDEEDADADEKYRADETPRKAD
jgi:hypothetical protein